MKHPRCKECMAVAYGGAPGLMLSQCIPHTSACSLYPSVRQRQEIEQRATLASNARARAAAIRLSNLGVSASVKDGEVSRVVISSEDATRFADMVDETVK